MKISRGVSELWRVENRPLPLTWPMAYTRACTTVQAVMFYTCYNVICSQIHDCCRPLVLRLGESVSRTFAKHRVTVADASREMYYVVHDVRRLTSGGWLGSLSLGSRSRWRRSWSKSSTSSATHERIRHNCRTVHNYTTAVHRLVLVAVAVNHEIITRIRIHPVHLQSATFTYRSGI